MNRATPVRNSPGAHSMTRTAALQCFGQSIDPHRLSPLARRIVDAIGDGTPALWAGIAWHGPVSHHPPRRRDHPRPSQAA